MSWFLIWVAVGVASLAQCRPQAQSTSNVEVQKQVLVELKQPSTDNRHPDLKNHRKIEDNTQEILDKIAEVNKKQGLIPRRTKPSYFHFPFSYSRSQESPSSNNNDQRSIDFKFPTNPFENPIFEHLDKEKKAQTNRVPQSRHGVHSNENGVYAVSTTDVDAEPTDEDVVPGQYIKRKITHQQAFLMPTQSSNGPIMAPAMLNNFPIMNMPQIQMPQGIQQPKPSVTVDKNLEQQTIENVKSIVSNSQPYPYYYNPYAQFYQSPLNYPYSYGYMPQQPNVVGNKNYQDKARQNWNWPGANLFPIYIRDPFLQMYYAVTNMIEYGPAAGNGGPCKLTPRPQKNNPKTTEIREGKTAEAEDTTSKVVFEMGEAKEPQITIFSVDGDDTKNDTSYLDIDSIDLGYSNDKEVKFSLNLRKERESSAKTFKSKTSNWDKLQSISKIDVSKDSSNSANKIEKVDFRPMILPSPTKPIYRPESKETPQSPPIRDQILHEDELLQDDDENLKTEDVHIQNDGTKKVLSRDNTGSGIFIHKLKVRKGGVAIAGPGGIATAGSGGTAIVGPQGVAYTHPDSLAIAGSGTKVVAVDPSISLSDIIKNSTLANGTRTDLPQRVGKVVAVGPVVYYNEG